jgi:hypothetical protein
MSCRASPSCPVHSLDFSITKIFKIYGTAEAKPPKLCRRFSRKDHILGHHLSAAGPDEENRSENGMPSVLRICVVSCKVRYSFERLQYYLSQLWVSIVIPFSSVHKIVQHLMFLCEQITGPYQGLDISCDQITGLPQSCGTSQDPRQDCLARKSARAFLLPFRRDARCS